MAVLIAKIARLDCPRFWPALLPTVLQSVQSSDELLQERSLLVMHHVIKVLASKRLGADRKVFEEVGHVSVVVIRAASSEKTVFG